MSSSLAEKRPWLSQQPSPPKQSFFSLIVEGSSMPLQVIWFRAQAIHASKRVFLLLPVPLPLNLESDKC